MVLCRINKTGGAGRIYVNDICSFYGCWRGLHGLQCLRGRRLVKLEALQSLRSGVAGKIAIVRRVNLTFEHLM